MDDNKQLDGYTLNVTADLPDSRDLFYRPPPRQLKSKLEIPKNLLILDQKNEGACTGFGLAAIINFHNSQRKNTTKVSARMLYEMARKHDEWPGDEYSGSSCRGAIKGFANMGVCRNSFWPYKPGRPGHLSIKAAKDARSNTVSAYYRLNHRVSDFHAALNESGVVYCSASVHSGWSKTEIRSNTIPVETQNTGGHAFAIVGYNSKGFWVQNSWGTSWGKSGIALWTYEDWDQNVNDAWVLNLALPTPQIWNLGATNVKRAGGDGLTLNGKTKRSEIAGHFVHIDDGKFCDSGRYWSNLDDVTNTAKLIGESTKYKKLLIYAHGGLNSPSDSASRIASMRDVFKDNGIYPFHFMYDTCVLEEMKDIVMSRGERVNLKSGGPVDLWDKILERLARPVGRALWREMKFGARNGFKKDNAGKKTLQSFKEAIEATSTINRTAMEVHIVGHSTGAILLAYMLSALKSEWPALRISSCSLLAPAITVNLFEKSYQPLLRAQTNHFGIDKMVVYNLSKTQEKDDSVGPYRKSLLYLVSRSLEEAPPSSLLGMQKYSAAIDQKNIPNLEFVYSRANIEDDPRCLSKTHGEFDNDCATMNSILSTVLGDNIARSFKKQDLNY